MPPLVHRFDPPERFIAGTVGEPGQRTFFLQARSGARATSVALENQQVDLPIDEPEPEELFVVRLTPVLARVFATRAGSVVQAGRPSCQFCGGPVDPAGHLCPRSNGYRRTQP